MSNQPVEKPSFNQLINILYRHRGCKIGEVRAEIHPRAGPGGRHQAWVTTPKYNKMVETPATTNIESMPDFIDRLASDLMEVLNDYYP